MLERAGSNTGIAALKPSIRTLIAIVVLALAIWVFFYVIQPEEPLTAGETSVVVAVSAAVVFSAKGIWARLHKTKEAG
jgi:hypothetical protein